MQHRRSSSSFLGFRSGGIYRHFAETIWPRLLPAYKHPISLRLLFIAVSFIIFILVSARFFLHPTITPVTQISDTSWQPVTQISDTSTVTNKPEFPLNCSLLNLTKSSPHDYYPKAFQIHDLNHNSVTQISDTSMVTTKPEFPITPVTQVSDTSTVTTKPEFPLNCSLLNLTKSCPHDYYPKAFQIHDLNHNSATCPQFFRWIHEDLRPWAETGITKKMVEQAKSKASFRLVILNGRAYVEKYKHPPQTRDLFTLWGFLQLLRRYPGKVPDLDLMFDSFDYPLVEKKHHLSVAPPPLFRYCGDDYTFDIVFPDWSFWGWAEINIKPWESLLKDLDQGNKRTKWEDRDPHAYWKGNPFVARHRKDLLKCNVSDTQDWNARLYIQDWIRESQQGFKESHLANQCTHRYKIYIEGSAWSVSEKYIIACDSVTLMVKPYYYDFFTRGLMPVDHYWPVKMDDKCRSIKFAVDWGNNHKQKAQRIGKAGSSFIQEDLKMDNVYDYMFHLLNGYSKLLKYKPVVPRKAIELCSETMACNSEGLVKKFMEESIVKGPADVSPCIMPPPYDPQTLNSILERKANSIKKVENLEKDFFGKHTF